MRAPKHWLCKFVVKVTYNSSIAHFHSYFRFHSIGLRKYGINSLRSLLVSLIPPAIFIAVMSMQLRYFNPKISSGIVSDASSLSMFSFHSSRTQTSTASRDSATVVDVPAESQEES